MTTGTATYVCRYCRQPSDPSGTACPMCGAPFDVAHLVSRSGWEKVPAIKDMTRIQFNRSHLQVSGSQVPVADFDLAEGESVYFNHHNLLWTEPRTTLGASGVGGGLSRMMAGMPLIMMQATGPGHVALSDNHAGDVIALPLQNGQQILVREHRFLAASGGLRYDWRSSGIWFRTGSGNDSETHYPLGQFQEVFMADRGPGLLLLHSPGNTFIRDLAPNETILVQPTALLYRDVSVNIHLHLEYPRSAGTFGMYRRYSMRNVWLRAVGPGRVAVQSIFARPETSEMITGSSYATTHHW